MLLLDSNYALPLGGDWGWGLVLLLILLYGAFRGWKNGLIREVISFTGFFIGLYLAYHYYKEVGWGAVGFLLIWIGVPLVLGTAAWLVTKVLDKVFVIGTVNRLLGAVAGFLKYAILLGCLIIVIDYVRETKHRLEENPVVRVLEKMANILFPMETPLPASTEGEGEDTAPMEEAE